MQVSTDVGGIKSHLLGTNPGRPLLWLPLSENSKSTKLCPPQEITRHFSNPIFNSQSKKPVPLDYEDTTPDLENPLSIWINSYIFSGPWHASRLDPQNETYSGINFSLITMLVLFNRTYLSPPWHVCSWSKQLNSAHIFLTKWRPPFK